MSRRLSLPAAQPFGLIVFAIFGAVCTIPAVIRGRRTEGGSRESRSLMTRQDAMTLVDYHYWARDRMLDAVDVLTPEQYTKDLASSFTSVRETVVHTYGAEWNWYLRWVGSSPTGFPDAAAFPDVATIRAAWRRRNRRSACSSIPLRQPTSWIASSISHVRRPGNGVGVLAHAAARREPRDVPPRPGDDDAETARRAPSEAAGSDQVLSGTSDESALRLLRGIRTRDATMLRRAELTSHELPATD